MVAQSQDGKSYRINVKENEDGSGADMQAPPRILISKNRSEREVPSATGTSSSEKLRRSAEYTGKKVWSARHLRP